MPLYRSLVTTHTSDDDPRDFTTNTVYHTVDANLLVGGVDTQNHADEIRDAFSAYGEYGERTITVRVYNMADAEPRPVLATSTHVGAPPVARAQLGPGEVACCLSFYSDRNLPRQRGRIFIGPFRSTTSADGRPNAGLLTDLLALGDRLFNIGGENVAHVIWSPTGNTSHVVHHYWVDDAWDTIRSRGLASTRRVRSDH